MSNFAALTKIIFALLVSLTALLTVEVTALAILLVGELSATMFVKKRVGVIKAGLALTLFAAILFAIQLLCGSSYNVAAVSALRMMIMSLSIVLILAATTNQQITAALVQQCHLPYSYAFMVTAILRFVPDLLAECKAVREAQSCRGYRPAGNPIKRLIGYTAVIKPMIFRSIERSEHMAVGLEMRGFNDSNKRTFLAETMLTVKDYGSMLVLASLCCLLILF